MPRVAATIDLSAEERKELEGLSQRRRTAGGLSLRAEIVLLAADGLKNKAIAHRVGSVENTVGKWRRRFAQDRLDGLYDEPRPGRPREFRDDAIADTIRPTLDTTSRAATHWSVAGLFTAPRVIPWVFAAKTTASGLIALLIAFALDLDQPKWALLTVFTVAQPQSGLIVAKSFYRFIGTLVGGAVALFLISIVAQERVLFLGFLAIWLAICTYLSKMARNFSAYGFSLAGWTAVMIGIMGAQDTGNAFFIAIARITEISVGIFSTALIGRLVLPLSLSDSLWAAVAAGRTQLCDYIAETIKGVDTNLSRATLIGQVITIDNQRASAVFEDPDIRVRSGALRRVGITALTLINVSYLLQQSLAAALSVDCAAEINWKLKEVLTKSEADIQFWRGGTLDSAGLRRCFDDNIASLPRARDLYSVPEGASSADASRAIVTIGRVYEFLDAFAAYAVAYDAALSQESLENRRVSVSVSADQIEALWAGLRSATAIIALSAFWILADWPNGMLAVIIGAALSSNLASAVNPGPAAMTIVLIKAIVAIPAFIMVEILLPRAAGFAMFALLVAPMLFCFAYLMGHKKTAALGVLGGVNFAVSSGVDNSMTYNPIGFINNTIAVLVAAAVTAVLFSVVAPDTPAARRRSFVRATRRIFARVEGSSIDLSELEAAFAAALNRLSQRPQGDRAEHAATLEASIAVLNIGRELIQFKERHSPTASGPTVERALLRFVYRGDAKTFDHARQAVEDGAAACLAELREDKFEEADTRAAARELAGYLAIGDLLQRSRAVFENWPTTSVRTNAV